MNNEKEKRLKEILEKNIYIFMRNGAIHEILKRGKDIKIIHETFQSKGIIFIPEINGIINSVDIIQIVDIVGYLKWVNQRRPVKYILNKTMRDLAKLETAGKNILAAVKEKELLQNTYKNNILPYKN